MTRHMQNKNILELKRVLFAKKRNCEEREKKKKFKPEVRNN